MPTPNQTIPVRGTSDALRSFPLVMQIDGPVAQDYTFVLSAPFRMSVNTVTYVTGSGDCDLNVKADGSTITGLGALDCNAVEGSTAGPSDGTEIVQQGENLRVGVSNINAATLVQIQIDVTRLQEGN